jgi:hypothetical protein
LKRKGREFQVSFKRKQKMFETQKLLISKEQNIDKKEELRRHLFYCQNNIKPQIPQYARSSWCLSWWRRSGIRMADE